MSSYPTNVTYSNWHKFYKWKCYGDALAIYFCIRSTVYNCQCKIRYHCACKFDFIVWTGRTKETDGGGESTVCLYHVAKTTLWLTVTKAKSNSKISCDSVSQARCQATLEISRFHLSPARLKEKGHNPQRDIHGCVHTPSHSVTLSTNFRGETAEGWERSNCPQNSGFQKVVLWPLCVGGHRFCLQ